MAVFFKEYHWGNDVNFQNSYNFTTFKFDMGLVYVLKIDQIAGVNIINTNQNILMCFNNGTTCTLPKL